MSWLSSGIHGIANLVTSGNAAVAQGWAGVFQAAFAFVLTFVGIAQVIVYARQAGIMRDQLKIIDQQVQLARDEFSATHRPKIRLKLMWLASADGKNAVRELKAGMPITVVLDVANIGSSTAKITGFNFMTCVLPVGEELPQRPPYNELDGPLVKLDLPIELRSGITYPRKLTDSRILNEEDLHNIRSGTMKLYLFGTIDYWDTSAEAKARQTAFCRVMDFPESSTYGRLREAGDPDYEYQD